MKNKVLSAIAVSTLLTAGAVAMAQPANNGANANPTTTIATTTAAATTAPVMPATAPQAGRYTGPSSIALVTVKQLLASAKDGQYAKLQGKIVSHDREKNYTFADDSGNTPVEISSKLFPPGQAISADQRVEVTVKVDKEWGATEFEVKQMRLLP